VVQGRAANFSTYATNFFARNEDGWKMIGHHASPGG
jgi:ketosteroid isomerase-like protein